MKTLEETEDLDVVRDTPENFSQACEDAGVFEGYLDPDDTLALDKCFAEKAEELRKASKKRQVVLLKEWLTEEVWDPLKYDITTLAQLYFENIDVIQAHPELEEKIQVQLKEILTGYVARKVKRIKDNPMDAKSISDVRTQCQQLFDQITAQHGLSRVTEITEAVEDARKLVDTAAEERLDVIMGQKADLAKESLDKVDMLKERRGSFTRIWIQITISISKLSG